MMTQLIILPCPLLRTDPESFTVIATHNKLVSAAQTVIILPKIVPSCLASKYYNMKDDLLDGKHMWSLFIPQTDKHIIQNFKKSFLCRF